MRVLRAAGCLAIALILTAPALADTLIGAAGPMTGSIAWTGEQLQRGAEAAVEDLNAKGGVLGQKVRLSTVDDACEGNQAVAAAQKLVSEGVVFVAGHNCSGASIPASAVYQQAGVLEISPSSTNPKLTELGRSVVFRVCGRDDQQGAIAAAYIAKHFAQGKIAILHDGTTYGRGLADEVRKDLHGLGVTEALFDSIVPDQTDYTPVVMKLKAAGATVLYYGGYAAEAGLIVRTAHDLGMTLQLMSGDAIATNQFLQVSGPAGLGTIFTLYPDARRRPEAAALVARFRDEGFEPEGKTLYTYATVQIWAQAAAKAGGLDIAKVLAAMHDTVFSTVIGPVSFNAKGDVNQPAFDFYIWKESGYEPLS